MKAIFCAAICLAVVIVGSHALHETHCKKTGEEIDSRMKDVIHMKLNPLLPDNPTNREEFCRPLKGLFKKAGSYTKCLSTFLAQVISIMASGIRKPIRVVCRGDGSKIMATYSCMDQSFLNILHQQEAMFLHSLVLIKTNVSREHIHESFCCVARNISESFLVSLPRPTCKGDPTIDLPKYFYNLLQTSLGDVLDLVCGSFPNMKTCYEKASNSVKFLEDNASSNIDTTSTPLVGTLLEVMGKLSS